MATHNTLDVQNANPLETNKYISILVMSQTRLFHNLKLKVQSLFLHISQLREVAHTAVNIILKITNVGDQQLTYAVNYVSVNIQGTYKLFIMFFPLQRYTLYVNIITFSSPHDFFFANVK